MFDHGHERLDIAQVIESPTHYCLYRKDNLFYSQFIAVNDSNTVPPPLLR